MERYGAPVSGAEKEVLTGFLNHYRTTVLRICEGLSEEELRRPMVESGLSLLSILKHLAYTELGWFKETAAGEEIHYPFDVEEDPDADWKLFDEDNSEDLMNLYRKAGEETNRILADTSLDDHARHPEYANRNLRWILVHVIEETARHAGHADILRELLDGKTGTGYE